MTWAATLAKAKFSEVLDKAESDGPQLVRRRKQEFYVLTREQYATAATPKKSPTRKKQNLAEFFRDSPLSGSGIDIRRLKLKPRHVEL